jgi:hypothetical protein
MAELSREPIWPAGLKFLLSRFKKQNKQQQKILPIPSLV